MATKTKPAPVLDPQMIIELVDKIGLLKASLAPQLKQLDDDLKKLKAQGPAVYEGKLYEVNVFDQERANLDLDAVREKLSSQFLTAHTTINTVRIAKVQSRKLVA